MEKEDLFGRQNYNDLPEMIPGEDYLPENPVLKPDEVPFVVVPTGFIYDNLLNPQELRLLIIILNLYNRKKRIPCYASNQWLADKIDVSEKTVANMISSLAKRNYLEVIRKSYYRYLLVKI